ncbi:MULTISPECIES: hypothetical protein [Bacillus]|uniref:hypothetical protein n=1 Tax=Bacillus TaxID=1386 RepID=UPI000BB88256|nr:MULTISPECIES: hypothetical protein [Bacillus]
MTLRDLDDLGLSKEQILAVPLDQVNTNAQLIDSLHRSDGRSLVDLAAIFGIIFMLLGVIYGYIFYLGPVIWGGIGLISGLLLGFIIDYLLSKKKDKNNKKNKDDADFILMINCPADKQEKVEAVLWNNMVLGVGIIK